MKSNRFLNFIFLGLIVALCATSCKEKNKDYVKVMHNPLLYSQVNHKLNYVVIYDIFTPPVGARVFAYANLAAYEVLAKEGHHFSSLEGKVKDLDNIPDPPANAKIDFPFASLIALVNVGNFLTFSGDTMKMLSDSIKLLAKNSGMPAKKFIAPAPVTTRCWLILNFT